MVEGGGIFLCRVGLRAGNGETEAGLVMIGLGWRGALSRSCVWAAAALAGSLMAAIPAVGQEEDAAEESAGAGETIEWNFRRVSGGPPRAPVDLRARWEAPFAVESSGRTAPREPRQVVLPRADDVARRTAALAADSGTTVARVTVEGERLALGGVPAAGSGAGTGGPAAREDAAGDSASAEAADDAGAESGEAGDEEVREAEVEDEEAEAEDAEDEDGAEAGAAEEGEDGEGGDADRPAPAGRADAAAASTASAGGAGGASTSSSPAAAARARAPTPARAGGRTHRVTYGETWYGIARQYRVPARELAAANPSVDPERLRAGTVLRIPPGPDEPRTHVVSRGDTLFGLARRYGVTPDAIRTANRMRDDVVRLGQTLVIPRPETSR